VWKNRGIGRAICQLILQQQDASQINLLATSRQGKDTGLGSNVLCPKLEIDDSSSIKAFVESLANRNEKVDVLINNAGTYLDSNYSIENVKKTLDVNYRGTLDVSALSMRDDVVMSEACKVGRHVSHTNIRRRCARP
jgi:carbonyl reductase 1